MTRGRAILPGPSQSEAPNYGGLRLLLLGNGVRRSRGEFDFAQRWTASVDWTTYEGAHEQLTGANAYVDPGIAERTGQRLRMPTRNGVTGP